MGGDENEIAHEGVIDIDRIATPDGPAEAGVPVVKFVHYPGAQQIVLWLPRSWHEGYEDLVVTRDGAELERERVSRRVNGSVQILWATIGWPPGDYRILITHHDGWRHEVDLRKHAPAQAASPAEPPPQPQPTAPIVYRDGFGRVIPDVDLQLREKVQREIGRRFRRRLDYEGNFRAGVITYDDGLRRIRFYHEMCGGELKFSIDVPPTEQWEAATGAPLEERDEIVAFVAERVRIEQANSWRYRITDRSIDFY